MCERQLFDNRQKYSMYCVTLDCSRIPFSDTLLWFDIYNPHLVFYFGLGLQTVSCTYDNQDAITRRHGDRCLSVTEDDSKQRLIIYPVDKI